MRIFYEKIGDEYVEVGQEFAGFPMNGLWLVKDGSQNCIERLEDYPTMPKYYPAMVTSKDEACGYVFDNLGKGGYSVDEVVTLACKYYASKYDPVEMLWD